MPLYLTVERQKFCVGSIQFKTFSTRPFQKDRALIQTISASLPYLLYIISVLLAKASTEIQLQRDTLRIR